MNGAAAWLQQAVSALHAKASALWNVLAAIAYNRPLPARDVIAYTALLIGLLFLVPKLVKFAKK